MTSNWSNTRAPNKIYIHLLKINKIVIYFHADRNEDQSNPTVIKKRILRYSCAQTIMYLDEKLNKLVTLQVIIIDKHTYT